MWIWHHGRTHLHPQIWPVPVMRLGVLPLVWLSIYATNSPILYMPMGAGRCCWQWVFSTKHHRLHRDWRAISWQLRSLNYATALQLINVFQCVVYLFICLVGDPGLKQWLDDFGQTGGSFTYASDCYLFEIAYIESVWKPLLYFLRLWSRHSVASPWDALSCRGKKETLKFLSYP